MQSSLRGRVVDTFAAKNLRMPMGLRQADNTGKYSLREGSGLSLRKYQRDKKNKLVI